MNPTLAILDTFGGPEILLIMVVVLIFFGGEKLPGFARGLGKAMRELKKAASDVEGEFKRAMDESEKRPSPPARPALAAPPAAPKPAAGNAVSIPPAPPPSRLPEDHYDPEIE